VRQAGRGTSKLDQEIVAEVHRALEEDPHYDG
jgi:hypothetical protein